MRFFNINVKFTQKKETPEQKLLKSILSEEASESMEEKPGEVEAKAPEEPLESEIVSEEQEVDDLDERIPDVTNRYFGENYGLSFFYVLNNTKRACQLGGIIEDGENLKETLNDYLTLLTDKPYHAEIREITFCDALGMLRRAEMRSFINDQEEILQAFKLSEIDCGNIGGCFGDVNFEEKLAPIDSPEAIYRYAEQLGSTDSLVPELDRIFKGKNTGKKMSGHPVHYMVEHYDRKFKGGAPRALISALYGANRLESRRYTYLTLHPDDDFDEERLECLYRSMFGGSIVFYMESSESEGRFGRGRRREDSTHSMKKLANVARLYRNKVLTVFEVPKEETELKNAVVETMGEVPLLVLSEDLYDEARALELVTEQAKKRGLCVNKKLKDAVKDVKDLQKSEVLAIFEEWYSNKMRVTDYPEYKGVAMAKAVPVSREKTDGETTEIPHPYEKLQKMIGLTEVKKVIDDALNYFKLQKLYAEKGFAMGRPAMHMVFTGEPGTAKTSVARLLGGIFRENGLLSTGRFVEVGRSDLVGEFVGHTAPKVKQAFKRARGGVLFIDEAYSLVDDRKGLFGDEAINTIVQEMENNRDDIIVIFAGYPEEMEGFLQRNPGLRSRIAFHVDFKNYSTPELQDIARLMAEQNGLKLPQETVDKMGEIFDRVRNLKEFGNGRFVRNLLEKAKMAQATRLMKGSVADVTEEVVRTLLPEDIEEPEMKNVVKVKNSIGFCA